MTHKRPAWLKASSKHHRHQKCQGHQCLMIRLSVRLPVANSAGQLRLQLLPQSQEWHSQESMTSLSALQPVAKIAGLDKRSNQQLHQRQHRNLFLMIRCNAPLRAVSNADRQASQLRAIRRSNAPLPIARAAVLVGCKSKVQRSSDSNPNNSNNSKPQLANASLSRITGVSSSILRLKILWMIRRGLCDVYTL